MEVFALAQLVMLGPVALASKIGHFPLRAKAIVPVAILQGLSLDKKHFLFQFIFPLSEAPLLSFKASV